LNELPTNLNETYERILLTIPAKMRKASHRTFQWLTVSSRPLRVEELAEVFAIKFDEETCGIPKFDPDWRHRNAERTVLSSCSTLVAIVDIDGEKRVQFSHFSVREYLTSNHIVASASVSDFHILPKPAHILLAKACLSVLFEIKYDTDETKLQDFPLARYAALHWMDHARFEDISSDIRDGMDCLFDKEKPHLAAWNWLYDIEWAEGRYILDPNPTPPDEAPLYHAALCGFRDLADRLLDKYPQDLNARGGYFNTPLHAAANRGHLDILSLFLDHGADVNTPGRLGQSALYTASARGHDKVVQLLIDHKADLNSKCGTDRDEKWTPLHVATDKGRLQIVRKLLEAGANVNVQDETGWRPLHSAARNENPEFVQVLLDHDAEVNAHNKILWTALHEAARLGRLRVVEVLLDRKADPHAKNDQGKTPFQLAKVSSQSASAPKGDLAQIMRLLSERTGEGTEDHVTSN
jgi:ankyrin repeat protein